MKRENRYGVRSLKRDFPNDEACLAFIFESLHSKECSCGGTYKLITGRRQYQCSKCRFQIAPTAGTIFHKSETPLTSWFQAILVFANAKSGISAKELERQLEVGYKTAWRILFLIRKALKQKNTKLSGDVEIDYAYFGGKGTSGANNMNHSAMMKEKSVVLGAVERGGRAKIQVIPKATAEAHRTFLNENVEREGTRLMTDSTNRLGKDAEEYARYRVNHKRKEFARGDVHVNTIESFWGHVKRSMKGTYKSVSKKHLQSYLDGFVFHYDNRHSDRERFAVLMGTLLRVAR